jgi:hypothetical protein
MDDICCFKALRRCRRAFLFLGKGYLPPPLFYKNVILNGLDRRRVQECDSRVFRVCWEQVLGIELILNGLRVLGYGSKAAQERRTPK